MSPFPSSASYNFNYRRCRHVILVFHVYLNCLPQRVILLDRVIFVLTCISPIFDAASPKAPSLTKIWLDVEVIAVAATTSVFGLVFALKTPFVCSLSYQLSF